ncbi:hypothetical protein B566_EDAN010219 [Ephemera danica]|nr:hypothetical protein B566_EDAN010219 [Ephemera danica]
METFLVTGGGKMFKSMKSIYGVHFAFEIQKSNDIIVLPVLFLYHCMYGSLNPLFIHFFQQANFNRALLKYHWYSMEENCYYNILVLILCNYLKKNKVLVPLI